MGTAPGSTISVGFRAPDYKSLVTAHWEDTCNIDSNYNGCDENNNDNNIEEVNFFYSNDEDDMSMNMNMQSNSVKQQRSSAGLLSSSACSTIARDMTEKVSKVE